MRRAATAPDRQAYSRAQGDQSSKTKKYTKGCSDEALAREKRYALKLTTEAFETVSLGEQVAPSALARGGAMGPKNVPARETPLRGCELKHREGFGLFMILVVL
jgi:hypothetical protein